MNQQVSTMNEKEKTELLRYSITRYDGYFQGVNSKIALYITLNTFILTATTAGGSAIIKQFERNKNVPLLFLILVVVMSAISILFTIKASIPYLKTSTDSVFFFGYTSNLSHRDYVAKIDNLNFKVVVDDLSCQAQALAKGLAQKYNLLKVAGYLLLADFACVAVLSLLLITKI